MSAMKRVMRDYGFFLVAIPGFIAIHFAWYRLQGNEVFVPSEARKNNLLLQKIDGYVDAVQNVFSGKSTSASSSSE